MSESWEFDDAEQTLTPEGFPWPPPEEGPILTAFAATWKGATFDPGSFFAETPRDGGTGAALLYYLAIGIFVAGATLFWDTMPFLAGATPQETWAAELGYGNVSPVVRFLLAPLFLLGGIAVSSGVVHVLLLIFNGATHGYGTTVRVFCYAYSPAIFAVVPLLGGLIGGIWSVVLVIIGLREAHEADAWKPAVAVLLPLAGTLILFFLVMFAAFMAAGSFLPAG